MNDDPPQVVFAQYIIGPDDRGDGFRTATNTGDDVLPNIRIETIRSVGGIMQPSNRESHGNGKTNAVVADRFLQDDKASGVFLFIGHDSSKSHFPTKGIQRILRIENRFIDPDDFKLLQIHTARIAHADQRGRPLFTGT